MGEYKRIERIVGAYIASRYKNVVEIGVGSNPVAARIIHDNGISVRCTDIRCVPPVQGIICLEDDIFSPDPALYRGADLIYSIRPAVEMVPPMISLARVVDADLLVYHLGFEYWRDGGELIDCGVPIHLYHRRSEAVKGGLAL
ncbi:MAG: hypothetical protein LUQ25_01140 [Methanoregulaceae archaeon]|nr:hypothetical protein [Methanoregulaceae archaeon]